MPSWLAPPRPAKKLSGMLMTSAQGHEMTRNVERAVGPHAPRGGIAHQKIDDRGQNGQRQRAVAHGGGVDAGKAGDERSERDLCELEFSISSKILDTVDSPKASWS